MNDQSQSIVFEAIDSINQQLPQELHLEKDLSTKLYEPDSALDSMDLVNFFSIVEDKITEKTSKRILIARDPLTSAAENPYRNVGTLIEFIRAQIQQ